MSKLAFTHNGKDGGFDTSPMHDDNYSRSDNNNGGDLSDTTFSTNDSPGVGANDISEGDVIKSYSFTAEQIVYSPGASFAGDPKKNIKPCDCEKNANVAKRGPHTGTITGTYSNKLQYKGVPATLQ
jgi:hypothetical protein